MPANDQLTALDATFLELEQADDSALMHIGAALLFDPLPGSDTPTIGKVREQLDERKVVVRFSRPKGAAGKKRRKR